MGKIVRTKRSKERRGQMVPLLAVAFDNGARLAPDQIILAETIARTGSISAAARELKMSYRHAWLRVEALNHIFARPLVIAATGGPRGGGATVTELGVQIVAAYRRAEERARVAIRKEFQSLKA